MMKLFIEISNNLNVVGYVISLLVLAIILVTNQQHFKGINTIFSIVIIFVICYFLIKSIRDLNTINLLLSSKFNVYIMELVGKLNLKPSRSLSDLFDGGTRAISKVLKTKFKTKFVSPVVYYTNMIKNSFLKAVRIVVNIVKGETSQFSTRSHRPFHPQFV